MHLLISTANIQNYYRKRQQTAVNPVVLRNHSIIFSQETSRLCPLVPPRERQRVIGAFAPLVVFQRIELLGVGLSPSEEVAEVLRAAGTDIHCRPHCATRQPQVNPLVLSSAR